MRLHQPFVRLPLVVDAVRLATEVAAIEEEAWRDHPEGAPGNTALPLVAAGGDPDDDATGGAMAPTPFLARLPYTREILAGLGATIGRSRLMRIADETELHAHVDTSYYWWQHLRVHVPVQSTPDVRFVVGGESVHMAPGEVWVFDTWRMHRVENPAASQRIHLVADTVGSGTLWELITRPDQASRAIEHEPDVTQLLPLETTNRPTLMGPDEVEATLDTLADELARTDLAASVRLREQFARFRHDWRDAHARFGTAPQGIAHFVALREAARPHAEAFAEVRLPNGIGVGRAVIQLVLDPAVHPDLAAGVRGAAHADAHEVVPEPGPKGRARPRTPTRARPSVEARLAGPPRIADPVFIVSSPRAGSSLLFETLARSPGLYTIGGESHRLIEAIPSLAPAAHDWDSNRLAADDATEGVVAHLKDAFVSRLRDREGRRPPGGPTRFLEKTPKNALRVPFLAEAFPDGRFVYLYRDPRETISSMLDAWRSGRFVTYPDLSGWGGSPWSLLLTPGWRDLDGRPLVEVVAEQWKATTSTLLDDLEALEPGRWCVASYDRLVADPRAEISQLCAFLGFDWDDELADPLPNSAHTLDSPHPDKWQRNAEELAPQMEHITAVATRARKVFAEPPRVDPIPVSPSATRRPSSRVEEPSSASTAEARTAEELFRSSHTPSFLAMLRNLGATLLITTYQAGRLVLVRHSEDGLNTHFRSLNTPMGVAYDGRRLAVGTRAEIAVFQNQADLTARLDASGRHDACFVIRNRHATGDIRVHDLAWADDGLWMANTRFSCLSIDDGDSNLRNSNNSGGGIAIYSSDATFTFSALEMTSNCAGNDGGAIWCNDGDADITIADSTFTDNAANSSGGAMYMDCDDVTITNSTFTDNEADDRSGALYFLGEALTITGSRFTGNTGDYGGALTLGGDTHTITGSTFSGNEANDGGGGGLIHEDGTLSVSGSTFSLNTTAEYGGAMYLNAGEVTITNSTISDNQAVGSGGGLEIYRTEDVTILNSAITGNTTQNSGGGMYVDIDSYTLTIANSTIANNTAADYGGGIAVDSGNLNLVQTTVSGNTATSGLGDGLYLNGAGSSPKAVAASSKDADRAAQKAAKHAEKVAAGEADPADAPAPLGVGALDAGTVTVTGTIIAGNVGGDDVATGSTAALTANGSLFGGVSGGVTVSDTAGVHAAATPGTVSVLATGTQVGVTNPGLGPLANNGGPTRTMAVLAGSPALNAGPTPVPAFTGNGFDQRGAGFPRVSGGRVDVGAFEHQVAAQAVAVVPKFTG